MGMIRSCRESVKHMIRLICPMLRFIGNIFMALVALGAVAFAIGTFAMSRPCASPIAYRIGSFDERFDISREHLLAEAAQATALWNQAAGKPLFVYDPEAKLSLDLVYDERQETTEQQKAFDRTIDSGRETADAVQAQYKSLQAQYESRAAAYEKEVSAFEAEAAAYSQAVRSANARGGADGGEYESLQRTRQELETEQRRLETERQEVNRLASEVNSLIVQYNSLAKSINETVKAYNSTIGEEFDEGTYDPTTKQISIYEFGNDHELLRVLAHEFGHALGLGHTDEEESIMYRSNVGESEGLGPADIAALRSLCKI